jgi:hypothetical protein
MQAIIVGMLRVIGGGFLGLAVPVAWLAYALFEGALGTVGACDNRSDRAFTGPGCSA